MSGQIFTKLIAAASHAAAASDQTFTKLVAAAPLAAAGLLVLLNPIYDRFIELGVEREFTNSPYLARDKEQTPPDLINQFTSWAIDVAQAGPLVLGPLIGLIAALSGKTNQTIGWIYLAFVLVGFAIFGCTAGVRRPVQYGKNKHGFRRDNKLWFGWTRVSIAAIILYLGAAVSTFFLA
jgi:hypothetical protein